MTYNTYTIFGDTIDLKKARVNIIEGLQRHLKIEPRYTGEDPELKARFEKESNIFF